MASPVFERMFYGSLADNSDIILVPDITTYAFSAMLVYIYTDKVRIDSVENAFELYYAAKKYIVPHCNLKCVSYLLQNITSENVCKLYEFSKLFDEPTLENKCSQHISNKITEIVASPDFMEIKLSTLIEILSMEKLMIPEIDLFIAFKNYAYANGFTPIVNEISEIKDEEKQNIYTPDDDDGSETNQINIEDLKPALYKIRFLTLSAQQFAEIPAKSGLLTESEALAILTNIISPIITVCQMPEGFSTSKIRRY
ncbi:BTB/POZ domain-containing protein 3-like isoform X2 [Condylostylus longicornis]|nr:BTB/POZ domain-containing protein 3-like isoform X2 [Condylostylus longicornis]